MHFTLTNPEWQPPAEAENFVLALRNQAIKDAATGTAGGQLHNPLLASIHSVSSLGTGVSCFSRYLVSFYWYAEGTPQT